MKRTALLLFTRTAKSEAVHKTFVSRKAKKANLKIAEILIQRSEEIAKHCNVPFFEITENDQHGNNFGEKYANAFKDVFSKGFDQVISIGNDCASLTSEIIRTAVNEIETKGAVIGPSKDGGAYLIGLSKDLFKEQLFKELSWQSNYLFEDLKKYLVNQQSSIEVLPTLIDIDNESDLSQFIQKNNGRIDWYFKKLIAVFFSLINFYRTKNESHHSLFQITATLLRGPPQLTFC